MSGQDVGFFFTDGAHCPDMVIENGDLKADNSMHTAALISLFSNRRVAFEQLPAGETDRQGWWADLVSEVEGDQLGSRLWLLDRRKIINATLIEAQSYIQEAFDWAIVDGIAAKVEATVERVDNEGIKGVALLYKPDGDNIPFKFLWDGQRFKLFED